MTDIVTPIPIDALPPAPLPTDTPAEFDGKSFALLGALAPMVAQTNDAVGAAHINATAAQEQAQAAAQERVAAVSETTAIKKAAVSETTAIKKAAVSETTAIKNAARDYRDAAAASALAAQGSANFRGEWSALTGPIAMPATVLHSGKLWLLLQPLADVTAAEPGVSAAWASAVAASVVVIAYDDRATLRSTAGIPGDQAIVDSLGLFVFYEGSDEPEDDESCFATGTGRWLLEAAHWDLVDAWQAPDDAVRDEYDEDEPLRFASSFASKVLTGFATCAITSVDSVASASFTGTVTGASVGDLVIATPPAALGNTDADSGRLSYHAWVSAADTVTVRLTNASAAAATTNTAILKAWPITVIKS